MIKTLAPISQEILMMNPHRYPRRQVRKRQYSYLLPLLVCFGFLLLPTTFSIMQVTPSDDSHYQKMIEIPDTSGHPMIRFYWKDPSDNELHARITHSSRVGWMGFGISPHIDSESNEYFLIDSDMIIAVPGINENTGTVKRYSISKETNQKNLVVSPLITIMQTLKNAYVYYTREDETDMLFVKKLSEPNFGEVTIPISGLVTFVYAYGKDGDLSKYQEKGTITIDLGRGNNYVEMNEDRQREWELEKKGDETVIMPDAATLEDGNNMNTLNINEETAIKSELEQEEFKEGIESELQQKGVQTAGETESDMKKDNMEWGLNTYVETDKIEKSGGEVTQEVLTNDSEVEEEEPLPCASDDDDYENMIPLNEYLKFYWTVKDEDVLSAKLVYTGQAWLGFGVSQNKKGKMIGSEAIIGLPDLAFQNGEVPLKHNLDAKNSMGVVKMEDDLQTLINASVTQDAQYTTLKFTKSLLEEELFPIHANSVNTFIWAVGSTNSLGHHKHHGVVRLNLKKCDNSLTKPDYVEAASEPILEKEKYGNGKKIWAVHGVFAFLAWAIASPLAIAAAWFRRLVPTTWIYIHVISNVLSYIFTVITVVIAMMSLPGDKHFTELHHFVGIAIFILATIQVSSGFTRPPVAKVNLMNTDVEQTKKCCTKPKSRREVWHFWHQAGGLLLLLLSMWQIQDGLRMYSENFGTKSSVTSYWAWVAFILLTIVFLKVKMICDSVGRVNDADVISGQSQSRMGSLHSVNPRIGSGDASFI